MSSPSNLLSDIFRIEDLNVRQAAKSLWDALNVARGDIGRLQGQIAALQAQDAATAAQLATVGVQGLSSVVTTLNQQVGTANDHPYVILQNSLNQTIADATQTFLGWDTEILISGGGLHSVSSNNAAVLIGSKPGVWLSVASVIWDANAAGNRSVFFGDISFLTSYVTTSLPLTGDDTAQVLTGLIVSRGSEEPTSAVGVPALRVKVLQTSGGDLDVKATSVWGLYYLSPLAIGQVF